MLRLRVQPRLPWRSIRFASQLSQRVKTAVQPTSILSRLSDRAPSRVPDAEQKSPTLRKGPRLRATSLVSPRSAQQRDHAAEKWFTDVQKLVIDKVEQLGDLNPLARKTHTGYGSLKQHDMRPRTDLNALFTPPTLRSATSLRLQSKRELGGDYTSYLPDGYADPHELPIDYARLILGRNRHIPLNVQAGALNIIEGAICGKTIKQAA